MYVTLVGNPDPQRYLLGAWSALVLAILTIVALAIINYGILSWVLSIELILSDFLIVIRDVTMNMLVLMIVTGAVASGTNVMGDCCPD